MGKYGPFLEQGERRASLPEGMPPEELTLEKALELLDTGQQTDEPLGECPDTHKPVFLKQGRFGPYLQLGLPDDPDKRNASLLKGMEPSEIDLATALRLLQLPKTLGNHPTTDEPVVASNGRYGPYVKCGSETRSLPADVSPLDVTLEEMLELLAQPKTRGRQCAAPKEPLKVFPESPVTGEPIKLLAGRYGPYVTDGTTNASLRKEMVPEEMTFEQACQMLAERAARGGSKRKSTKKKAKATKKMPPRKRPRKRPPRKRPPRRRRPRRNIRNSAAAGGLPAVICVQYVPPRKTSGENGGH